MMEVKEVMVAAEVMELLHAEMLALHSREVIKYSGGIFIFFVRLYFLFFR